MGAADMRPYNMASDSPRQPFPQRKTAASDRCETARHEG